MILDGRAGAGAGADRGWRGGHYVLDLSGGRCSGSLRRTSRKLAPADLISLREESVRRLEPAHLA